MAFQPIDKERIDNEDSSKVILLHGFSDAQLHEFLEHYRASSLPDTIFASITPKSKLKRVRDLLKELEQEKRELKQKV